MINNSDNKTKISIIILNYNSWKDTIECFESLQKIDYPEYLTIIVDNCSTDSSVEKIKAWANGELKENFEVKRYGSLKYKPIYFLEYNKEIAEKGGIADMEVEFQSIPQNRRFVLIKNNDNLGYSAGNNVGIRYAIKKNADAVLIINPDVRIKTPDTLKKMVNAMFSRDDIFVVGPNIVNRDGKRESPLKEVNFLQECAYPFFSGFRKMIGKNSVEYVEPIISYKPYEVNKVSGSCVMIRISFLKGIGLLDENVFLFCEEPILSAQVKNKGGKLFFVPEVVVEHKHKKPSKILFKEFTKSRIYFLRKYKKYNKIQLLMIMMIHRLIYIFGKKR